MSVRKWYLRAFITIPVVALVGIGLGIFSGDSDPEFFRPQQALAAIRADVAPGELGSEPTLPLPQSKTPVAFVNVAVIPMTDSMDDSGRMLQAQTVIVEGDRVTTIGPVGEVQIPEDATVIDGTGKYLMPGLTDMHVHIYSSDGVRDLEDLNPLYLNYGVTSIVSMNGNDELLRIRQQSRTQEVLWPTVYTASPVINPPAYSTPDEVERAVVEFAQAGYDFIKVYENNSAEAFERLMTTAQREDIEVIGHAQRSRDIQATLDQGQDLAHAEEYFYAYFNPFDGLLKGFTLGVIVLLVLLGTNIVWAIRILWRRARKGGLANQPQQLARTKWMFALFTLLAWTFFLGFFSVTPPLAWLAGLAIPRLVVTVVAAGVLLIATASVWQGIRLWKNKGIGRTSRVYLNVLAVAALVFAIIAIAVLPRAWRTTDASLERIAQATADAGIWVVPNMVFYDYIRRVNGDEYYSLGQRDITRYMTRDERAAWTAGGGQRGPGIIALWGNQALKRQLEMMKFMVGAMHRKGVPLLAGSDFPAVPGLEPGYSLHEELKLLVQSGLSPYEALRTATTNPAKYLRAEDEFGTIAEGMRADLFLVGANPLEDINNLDQRVGVMFRGLWLTMEEMVEHLDQLALVRGGTG